MKISWTERKSNMKVLNMEGEPNYQTDINKKN